MRIFSVMQRTLFTSPIGRGRLPSAARKSGEGLQPIENPSPPHPDPLPAGERERALHVARMMALCAQLVCCQSLFLALVIPATAQISPSAAELQAYQGLHAAAAKGDVAEIEKLVRARAPIDARDGHGRTPLHVAAFMHKNDAARALMRLGADRQRAGSAAIRYRDHRGCR